MPPDFYCLVAKEQGLRNPLSIGVFGQAVAAVFRSGDFPYGDLSLRHTILDPQFTELYVSDCPSTLRFAMPLAALESVFTVTDCSTPKSFNIPHTPRALLAPFTIP